MDLVVLMKESLILSPSFCTSLLISPVNIAIDVVVVAATKVLQVDSNVKRYSLFIFPKAFFKIRMMLSLLNHLLTER